MGGAETATARTLQHPAVLGALVLLSVTGAGGHLLGQPLTHADVTAAIESAMLGREEVAAVVVAAIQADRSERLDGQETRLAFVHRVDTEHEECVTAPSRIRDGDDVPTWAEALVDEMRWLRCDTRRSNDMLLRMVE